MKQTFVSSDLHFFHKNILKYNPEFRPWQSMEEMHEGMIEEWNKTVKHCDMVYLLGDISFGKADDTAKILRRMQGKKILIKGNHDSSSMRNSIFRDCFSEIHDYLERRINEHNFVMFHFPIWSWHRIHHGAIHLHGHEHGKPTGIRGRILDVGWDAHGKILSIDEVIEMMKRKEIRGHGTEDTLSLESENNLDSLITSYYEEKRKYR